jgi:hypothetical protein
MYEMLPIIFVKSLSDATIREPTASVFLGDMANAITDAHESNRQHSLPTSLVIRSPTNAEAQVPANP